MSDLGDAAAIRWDAAGLATVVTVDAASGDVLMVASMNHEALERTRATGMAHYWSRSRNELWRKGATSGHEQRLVEIRINCNHDSLLLRVEQRGAVCHDGYPTCYYRTLDADGTLREVRDRAFDPATVYGNRGTVGGDRLATAAKLWIGAYLTLREEDHEATSRTSRRLREADGAVSSRLADELEELAGVLDGSHRHGAFAADVALEATQCLYWALLAALRAGLGDSAIEDAVVRRLAIGTAAAGEPGPALRAIAERWRTGPVDVAGAFEDAVAVVAAALGRAGLEPLTAIEGDLADLRVRPYLDDYFRRAATD